MTSSTRWVSVNQNPHKPNRLFSNNQTHSSVKKLSRTGRNATLYSSVAQNLKMVLQRAQWTLEVARLYDAETAINGWFGILKTFAGLSMLITFLYETIILCRKSYRRVLWLRKDSQHTLVSASLSHWVMTIRRLRMCAISNGTVGVILLNDIPF